MKDEKKFWKTLDSNNQPSDGAADKLAEFSDSVKGEFDPEKDLTGLSRRKFLALLGASAAMTAAGCSDYPDRGEIIPYTKKPEEITLGKANYYASTCTACELACGILIKTREGRPLRVDGNPDHPVNKGKICSLGQAHILNLYDPSRITEPFKFSGTEKTQISWKKADAEIISALKNSAGKEIAVLLPPVVSPTFMKLLDDFKQAYPTTVVYQLRSFDESARRSAWKALYGTDSPAAIDWNKAKVILSLEGDFLGNEGSRIEQVQAFTSRRDVDSPDTFCRLYSVEANLSLTGINADYRFRLKPEQQYNFAMALANEIVNIRGASAVPVDGAFKSSLSAYRLEAICKENKLQKNKIDNLVDDLIRNRGNSIVFSGRALDTKTHSAALLLNEIIGGSQLYKRGAETVSTDISQLETLHANLKAGNVGVMLIMDLNPAFTLPMEFGFSALMKNAALVVTMSEFENETTSLSNIVLPMSHTFESWGDATPIPGVFSTQQPVIAPLFKTRQKEAALLVWKNGNPDGYSTELYLNYLKTNWQQSLYPAVKKSVPFDQFWQSLLHDGVVQTTAAGFSKPALNVSALSAYKKQPVSPSWSMMIYESYRLGDGKYAQNGWLQELPHPVSKMTWDNYAAISKASADELGVNTEDTIDITINGKTIALPVVVQPGLADRFIAIEAGYGRTSGSVVAVEVGTNVYPFRTKLKEGISGFVASVSVQKGVGRHKLASTQDHHTFNDSLIEDLHHKREIIREGTLPLYLKDKMFLHEHAKHEPVNMYPEVEYTGPKWAMAIDMNKCIGCGECSLACSVENNIPVVGKDQVLMSREMHWLRIDRYYSGTAEEPNVSMQPMLCQHCDQAPCENVCPVVATNHSPDGLNQMVYNRCVGTRYCSNNCPYKVRKFNFFNFRDHFEDGHYLSPIMELAANPEVTTRSRGVMEKCTFCVHRISEARSDATAEGRTFTGEGITSACQDACPSHAITFGNMNDPQSAVAKLREHHLGYVVLEELNIRPNVTYIAKLRNTHSEGE